jgi:hypothetical protein
MTGQPITHRPVPGYQDTPPDARANTSLPSAGEINGEGNP